jgi:putative membrane protein
MVRADRCGFGDRLEARLKSRSILSVAVAKMPERERGASGGLRKSSWFLLLLSAIVVAADAFHFGLGADVLVITHTMYLALPMALIAFAWCLFGRRFAIVSSVLLFLGGVAVEVVGSRTGIPFGQYYYTGLFQPQLFGVPLEIALGWLTLGLMCYSLASQGWRSRWYAVPVAALLMVSWDVLYDPVFTGLGMWVWRQGSYFGVPLTNFLGWFLASLLFFGMMSLLRRSSPLVPDALVSVAPFAVYLAYLVDGSASNVSLGHPIAAIVGASLMLLAAAFSQAPRLAARAAGKKG